MSVKKPRSVKQTRSQSYSVRAAVAFALGTAAMLAAAGRAPAADQSSTVADNQTTPAAGAQGSTSSNAAAAGPVTLEEVTVTGSRIKRRDLQTISPLVTVDSSTLQQSGTVTIESYLNQLPNYNPAETPTTENEDVQPSAVNTVGIATISLRGLGPNRSLVLIDGHRTTPINALMVTDINTIPSAMIERVETITGGASAVYGADAIGGVTNFILKKNFQGAELDVQDSETQAGDGNQLDVSGIMGTAFSQGQGHIIMGLEYFNRAAAYQKNRDFYTSAWNDPNQPQTQSNALFVQGFSGYSAGFADAPSNAALAALWPGRPSTTSSNTVCSFGGCNPFGQLLFNPNGTLWTNAGSWTTSNYAGPDPRSNAVTNGGYSLQNELDGTELNNPAAPPPDVVQGIKWNNPWATISEPQTRYSFFANGTYNFTDDIQFFTNARYASSLTTTLLDTPTTGTYGWEAEVPFNATTDSPINPSLINATTTQAQLQAIAAAFAANPTSNPYTNPSYIGPSTKGAQHPVPWQLAMLLLSRGLPGGVPGLPPASAAPFPTGIGFGAPIPCNPALAVSGAPAVNCPGGPSAPTSWILDYLPAASALQRSSIDTAQVWQIETGLNFPLHIADWTGELYYSRGQSTDYEVGYGNDSLQRFRAVVQSPDYGAGQTFQGNYNGADTYFGTSVPSTCTSGFYNTFFAGDQAASANCMSAVAAPLQTETQMQQDIVEANFNGSVFKLPAGELSGALGFQYRRDAGQFIPDNLQSTYSFLDQAIGLYPLGTLNNEISTRDGYGELFIPVLSNLPMLKKLDLDVGGRYSSFSAQIPNATTFKVSMDAQITNWFRLRGGFNRATRAPNLGELYLGEQEYFGGGAQFGDPCSVRSNAPFGAAGAAPDFSTSGTGTAAGPGAGTPTKLAGGQTAAGAMSTYLICQAMMGGTPPTPNTAGSTSGAGYYYGPSGGAFSSQSALAAAAPFGWLNEQGNPNLQSETANTITAGIVFSNLGDNPWIAGLNGSIDYWDMSIKHAIELDSPDYANYLCYGTVTVTNMAQAIAQAQSPACQNVPRNPVTGGAATSLLEYTNSATIGIAGVDMQLNWFAQLADLGLKVPGGISFNTQDSFLQYYKTKASPTTFDVDINWKDSLGPTLAGTNFGAYGYRLTANLGYVLPSWTVNLRWIFYPSVNSANHAMNQAIIDYDNAVAKAGGNNFLSYTPNTDIATKAWWMFDLTGSWTVNRWLQLRGGINNLLNREPPVAPPGFLGSGASAGYPPGTNLNAVCGAATARGCVNPSAYSLPTYGLGNTNTGFYDVYGRTFFLGFKASF